MSHEISIAQPSLDLGDVGRGILESLPAWFGIPAANAEYVEFVRTHPTWSAIADGRVIGILAPAFHAQSAEIHLIAVRPEWHRCGVGRQLVDAFEADARANGLPLAQVKTLGPSDPDAGYAATRRFYAALGYFELEEFDDLWPGTPALLMVKRLA